MNIIKDRKCGTICAVNSAFVNAWPFAAQSIIVLSPSLTRKNRALAQLKSDFSSYQSVYYTFIELFTNRMKVKVKHLQRFFSSDASGGIVLIIAAALAMVMANTSVTSGLYHSFLDTPVQLRVGALEINKNMLLWINDALMAVFFLLIGTEVKRELIQGSLASRRQAVFPVIAALGGMIVPALVYLAFNAQDPVAREGWAIPAATDIAFALGVLALLGNRVPTALKIFLMALAIIDDLGAIVIIALFYTHDLSMLSLGVAAAAIAVLVVLNLSGVRRTGIYILVGAVLWTAVLKSGVHATLAGVIVGFMIPLGRSRVSHRLKCLSMSCIRGWRL